MHFTDFFPTNLVSIHAGSRPTVQYVASLSELPQALLPYYTQGYVLAALHPIILSVGRTRSLPFSLLYRAILARPRPRYTNPGPVLIFNILLQNMWASIMCTHRSSTKFTINTYNTVPNIHFHNQKSNEISLKDTAC